MIINRLSIKISSYFGGSGSSADAITQSDVCSAMSRLSKDQSLIIRSKYINDVQALKQLSNSVLSLAIKSAVDLNLNVDIIRLKTICNLIVCEFVMNICPHCKGVGKINMYTKEQADCSHCRGTGTLRNSINERKKILKDDNFDQVLDDLFQSLKDYLVEQEYLALHALHKALR